MGEDRACIAERALKRYGLGDVNPVLLEATTNLVFLVQSPGQQRKGNFGEGRDVFGFIHADLHQWNYLFHGQDVRAIDFDDCGWGYYAYDIVVTLSYLETALQDAFLAGYRRVRPLPAGFCDYRDVFLAARILVMVAWILSWPQPSYRAWGPAYLQQAAGRLRRIMGR